MSKIYFCSLAIAFLLNEFSNVDAKMSLDQLKAMAKPWGPSCAKKVGLSPELQAAHARGEFPEDDTLMCYLLCNAKMGKIMDKTGKVDIPTIKQQLSLLVDDQLVERMLNVCQTCADKTTASESCRIAWEYSKCYYEMDKEIYLFS